MDRLIGGGRKATVVNRSEEKASEVPELLLTQSSVGPDGDDAKITIQTSSGPLELSVQFDQIAAASLELGQAGTLMLRRRLMRADHGKSAFEDLIRAAPKPADITPIIDKATGECVVIYRFDDRLPFVVRLTMEQIEAALELLSSEVKNASN